MLQYYDCDICGSCVYKKTYIRFLMQCVDPGLLNFWGKWLFPIARCGLSVFIFIHKHFLYIYNKYCTFIYFGYVSLHNQHELMNTNTNTRLNREQEAVTGYNSDLLAPWALL